MSLGPFLRREWTTSVRGLRAFGDRRNAAFLTAAIVAGSFVLWDWRGWDRSSVDGGQRFGLATLGLVVAGMGVLGLGLVIPQVASAIAAERDRKTLDALLASRFGGAEIVLGAVAAGLFRYANALAAMVPVVVLMVFLGGVGPGWAILAGSGLASTATLMASASVAASVGAPTAIRAVNRASGLFGLWIGLPTVYLVARRLVWPGSPPWLTSAFLAMSDGSPIGLLMNLGGMIPRPGGPAEAVARMVAWQSAGSVVLIAWAVARLRPASRGLHDVAGEATRLRAIRAAIRRPPRRPPCSDDPVLWHAIHADRGPNAIWRLLGRAIGLGWLGALAWGTWWLAVPAFEELARRGYGAMPEAATMPELNPFARLLIGKVFSKLPLDPAPGQARLEFNIALRLFSGLYAMAFVATTLGGAAEGLKGERRRDTWLGLIATPLTGREILRGKLLGALWKAREVPITLISLWTVGLLAGSVHPMGYLAALGFLAASGPFYAALGLALALAEADPRKAGLATTSPAYLAAFLAATFLLTLAPIALCWGALVTYEDLDAVARSAPFPEFAGTHLGRWMEAGGLGARAVVVAWLLGLGMMAAGAFRLVGANARGFDEAVGRPVRPPSTSVVDGGLDRV